MPEYCHFCRSINSPLVKTLYLFALLCSFSVPLTAQAQLRNDSDWFWEQTSQYQRWLDREGLAPTLRVQDMEVDTMVVLYLRFPFSGRDSVLSAWRQLKQQYDAQTGTPLETRLFYRAAGVFDVDVDHVAVKIFDTYHPDSTVCFYRGIFAVQGVVKVDSFNCRTRSDYVAIQPADLRKVPKTQQAAIAKRVNRATVFGHVKTFLLKRYGSKQCQFRSPILRWVEDATNSDVLEFEVLNLCDEVIQEDQPKLAQVLNYFGLEQNWKKNEKLTLRFQYKPSGAGFVLDILVDGRYGSGFYENVGRRGYKDMEVDFAEELAAYTRELKKELNAYLLEKL